MIWLGVVCVVLLWVIASDVCAGLGAVRVVFRAALLVLLLFVRKLAFLALLRVGACLGCQSGSIFCVQVVSVSSFGVGWFVCARG